MEELESKKSSQRKLHDLITELVSWRLNLEFHGNLEYFVPVLHEAYPFDGGIEASKSQDNSLCHLITCGRRMRIPENNWFVDVFPNESEVRVGFLVVSCTSIESVFNAIQVTHDTPEIDQLFNLCLRSRMKTTLTRIEDQDANEGPLSQCHVILRCPNVV